MTFTCRMKATPEAKVPYQPPSFEENFRARAAPPSHLKTTGAQQSEKKRARIRSPDTSQKKERLVQPHDVTSQFDSCKKSREIVTIRASVLYLSLPTPRCLTCGAEQEVAGAFEGLL